MRVLVTGSVGFIGTHTLNLLESKGYEVLGIDRNSNLEGGIRGDVTDTEFVHQWFKAVSPDAVLHIAANASLQKSLTNPVYDAMQNIIGTIVVLGAARRIGCRRFVFASTSAVYGPKESGVYLETDPVIPQVPYGVSKAAGEMYVRCSGLSYAILRYGNVYGPGQKPLGENILIARALAHLIDGEPFKINGDGEQVRDWIYVEDVVDANIAALFSEDSGTFNIATGKGISVNEVIAKLMKLVGHKKAIHFGAAKLGELRSVILDSNQAKAMLKWEAKTKLVDGLAQAYQAWTL